MSGSLLRMYIVNGRIGHDPDHFTPIGEDPYVRVSVAVNTNIKTDTGEWSQRVDWVKVRCYAPLGERVAKFLRKGDLVFVEGTPVWVKNEDGRDVELRARDVQFAGKCILCGGKR